MAKRASFLNVAEPAGSQFGQVCPSITVNKDLFDFCKQSVSSPENLAMTNVVNPDERPCNILQECGKRNNAMQFPEPSMEMAFSVCTGETTGFEDTITGISRPYTEDERQLACERMNAYFAEAMAKKSGSGSGAVYQSDSTTAYILGGVALLAVGAYLVSKR
jgi:hypothetical protein|tara:strand:- start:1034 stop:1519 length:486 start_codon:yes stop_codon:yes gene_type:complete